MAWNYTASIDQPHGKAVGVGLPISTKHAIEISTYLRGKSLKRAKMILAKLLRKEDAIPFKQFKRDVGHKPGIATGRYPVKAGTYVLELINSAASNASAKGLSEADLYIAHICAQRGQRSFRGGRKGRVQNKNTHIEVILVEGAEKKTRSQKTVKTSAKADTKKETKSEHPVQHKEEKKETAKKETPKEEKTTKQEKPATEESP